MNELPVPICTSLLPPEDVDAIFAIGASLTHAMQVVQRHRTETEMRISVLDDVHHPTPAAKYYQAIREQCCMTGELSRLFFEQRRNDVKRQRAQRALAAATDDALDREDAQIDIDECNLREQMMRYEAIDRAREIKLWEQIKDEQLAADPTIDRFNADTHQLISYTRRYILESANADPTGMSFGEQVNQTGLLFSALRRCLELNVLDLVLDGLPPPVREFVRRKVKDDLPPPPRRLRAA